MAQIYFKSGALLNLIKKFHEEGYEDLQNIEEIESLLPKLKNNNSKLYDNIHPYYLGALGEIKAIDELDKLSNNYHIINNVSLEFEPPIYNRKENDRIQSIQVDHVVVGPSGVFLIETKNWSEKSIRNQGLFSPVTQIKRHGFALFFIINQAAKNGQIQLKNHHWGERSISTRNIILMIGSKPEAEFEFVKILALKEIKNYVEYFPKTLSESEVESIVNLLTRIEEVTIKTKKDSIQKKVIKQSASEKKLFRKKDRFYYSLENGGIREITGTVVAGVVGFFIGMVWSIFAVSLVPLFLLPLLGLGFGFIIDLAIEDERKKKKEN